MSALGGYRGLLRIGEAKRKSVRLPRLDPDDESTVFLRPVRPGVIEYALARDLKAARTGEYTMGPYEIALIV